MSKSINLKFNSDRRSQASAQHLFDALLGKPPSPTCAKCGGLTGEGGPLAGRCGCVAYTNCCGMDPATCDCVQPDHNGTAQQQLP